MSGKPSRPVTDTEDTFRILVRTLTRDHGLSPRGAVILDLCGKAMGLPGDLRRELAHRPAAEALDPEKVVDLVELRLEDAPEEIRTDALCALEGLLGMNNARRVDPPLCPVCKHRDHPGVRLVWTPPPATGLGPIEATRHTTWLCMGCHSLLDCTDRIEAPMRSRTMKIRVTGPEMQGFLRDLRTAGGDPSEVVRTLSNAPTKAWMLERVPGVRSMVWTALTQVRDRILEDPALAPEAYTLQGGVIRMGAPATPLIWTKLVSAPLPDGLLARLARLPGAPPEVRAALIEHDEIEVRHQALQAPDVPAEVLRERLEHGDTVDLLSILDRGDVGARTLSLAIERGDPHVLYRTGRHGALDLLLLDRVRDVRRRQLAPPLPASRVLHVYAPGARCGGSLTDLVRARIVRVFEEHGYEAHEATDADTAPSLDEDGGFCLVGARVSLSRLLIFLPVLARDGPGSLDLERLVGSLKQSLASGLAEEVVELTVDEECRYWDADIHQRGCPPQRLGASDLSPPDSELGAGRWLEFELFCSERALAYPGLTAEQPTPRLITRAPYAAHSPETEWRQSFVFTPRSPARGS